MKQPIVQVREISKVIQNKKIIDHCSFELYPGEVVGFLGPNGAGKTTTIRMMVGLMAPTSGQIIIDQYDVQQQLEEALNQVGAIVENPEMYKHLTGYQNLEIYARAYKGINKQRIDEVTQLVGLESRIHDKVKNYSLGMRQRLGLAQALLHKPKILILDEPNNGLDPAGIREFRDHLRRLAQEEQLAILVSSHLLSEIELLCDRIIVIQSGKILGTQNIQVKESEEQQLQVHFIVDQKQGVLELLKKEYPDYFVEDIEKGFKMQVHRSQIPTVNRLLVMNQYDVYEIHIVSASLEDQFLAMTGGRSVE